MEKNERVKKNKKGDKNQRLHKAKQSSEPMIDKSSAWNTDQSPLMETPFYSRMDEHTAALSRIPFSVQRQEYIMRLNSTYGLRYVQRLLQSVNAQAKLTVSSPGDISEQEADRVAEEVTRGINAQTQRQEEEELLQGKLNIQRQVPEEEEELLQGKLDIQRQVPEEEEEPVQMMPNLQRQEEGEEEEEELQTKPILQRQTPEEEEELIQGNLDIRRQVPEEEEELQMQPQDNKAATVADEIETHINSARSSGQPLSNEVKKPMEQAFQTDFSNVKIHTDTEADTLNKQLSARAFTTGKDVFFRDGEYSPGSESGNKLIAHELTHVMQQNGENISKNNSKTYRESIQISQKGNINKTTVQRSSFPNFDRVNYPREIEEVQYGVGEVIRFSNITSCLGIIVKEDDKQVRGIHIPVQDSEGTKVTDAENIVDLIWKAAGSKATNAIFVGQIENWNKPGPDIAIIDVQIQTNRDAVIQWKREIQELRSTGVPTEEEQDDIQTKLDYIEYTEKRILHLIQTKMAVVTREIYQQLLEKFNPSQQVEGMTFAAYIENGMPIVVGGGDADIKWEQYKKQREVENLQAHEEWMKGNIY